MGRRILGREAELARVVACLGDATSAGRAIVLSGEAGIGKTTIWREGVRRAGELGFRTLVAQPAETEASVPYAALADLLAGYPDAPIGRLPAVQRTAVEVALARGETAGPVDQHALSRGVIAMLAAAASDGPLLVAVDDAQWLDAPTATALAFAIRRLAPVRIRILVAVRAAERPPSGAPLGLDAWEPPPLRLEVEPLAPTELGAILRAHLGRDLARPRVEALARASGGNPMLAVELARAGFEPGGPAPTLVQALAARIRRLDGAGRDAVAVAAAALQPTVDLLVRAGVEERALDAAVAAEVLIRDGERVAFAHPLLASVAYDSLLPGERRDAHERLGAVGTRAVERGHHLSRSAVAPSTTAAEALDEAAREASELGDPAGAAAFWLRAAELSPAGGEAVAWLRVRAARALESAGDVERAAALARSLRDELPAGLARADVRQTLVSTTIGVSMTFEEGLAELSRALDDARGDDRAAAGVQLALADMTMTNWRLAESRAHLAAALGLARRAGADELVTAALSELGFLDSVCGLGVTASAVEAYERWDGARLAPTTYSPRLSLACERMHAGELEEAERLLLEEVAAADERGVEGVEILARSHLAEVRTRAGDWGAALVDARLAVEHARQAGNAQTAAASASHLAWVLALLGDHGGARELAVAGLETTEAMQDVWFAAAHRSVLGLVALTEEDHDRAVEALEPAWARMLEAGVGNPAIVPIAPVLGEAYAAAGRLEDALAVARSLRDAPAAGLPSCRATASRLEALVASVRGDHAAARALLEDALAAHAETAEPFERARTLHLLGRVERRARAWGAARAALGEALTAFDTLGAARWAEKAAADLARLPGRRPSAAGELTETERRVAALVADGLTNKEVASRLFVTVRAVEANLSRVYAKLGVRSRTELARVLDPR